MIERDVGSYQNFLAFVESFAITVAKSRLLQKIDCIEKLIELYRSKWKHIYGEVWRAKDSRLQAS